MTGLFSHKGKQARP